MLRINHLKLLCRGKISDSSSGEALSGASLYIVELKQAKAVAEEDGVYRISLPDLGIYTLQVSHIGYKSQTIRISSSFFQVINIKLEGNATLKEVVVTAKTLNENITRLHMGVEKLDIIQIRQMPAALVKLMLLKQYRCFLAYIRAEKEVQVLLSAGDILIRI